MKPHPNQNFIEPVKPVSSIGRIVIALLWLIPVAGVMFGAFILITGFINATTAPQEAVVAALACACAILPYCFTRAVTEIIEQVIRK